MSQINGTEMNTAVGGAAANFLAAIRGGLSLVGSQNAMFSDLLKQISPAGSGQSLNGKSAASEVATSSAANGNISSARQKAEIGSEDRAKLKSLLQRMKSDADALREKSRDAKVKGPDKNDGVKESAAVTDDAEETETMAVGSSAEVEESGGVANEAAKEDDSAQETSVEDELEAVLGFGAEELMAAQQEVANDVVSSGDEAAIVEDLKSAEQEVLAIFQKLFSSLDYDKGKKTQTEEADIGFADAEDAQIAGQNANMVFDALAHARAKADSAVKAAGTENAELQQQDFGDAKALPSEGVVDAERASVKSSVVEKGGDFKYDFRKMFGEASTSVKGDAAVAVGAAAKGAANVETAVAPSGAEGVKAVSSANISQGAGVAATGVKHAGSYDFASQLSAARATKGGNAGLPSVVEQVSLQINKQVREGVDKMTINLRPAELGKIEVKLEFSADNRVSGTVVADNPATLELLLKDVGSLQRALQDAGLRADAGSLQFSLRDDNSGFAGQNANNGDNRNSGGGGYESDEYEEASGFVSGGVETYFVAPGRVNIKV